MPRSSERLHSRPPWERMMFIHQQLQRGGYPNCKLLAEEIEVSKRTILRDIEFMKDRLHLPIEYDELRYGYYYTRPVEQFPAAALTEAEMFAMLVAHKAIAQYHGTPFHRPLEAAFRRLTGQLDSSTRYTLGDLDAALSFRPFAPEDTDLETFQILTQALREQRVVRFHYRNLGKRCAQLRTVHPRHLACIGNHWYLFAFDLKRLAIRTFVLTRLSQPKLTDRRFDRPAKFDPDEYLRGSFTVFKGGDDYEVVIDFDAWATDLMRGRKWHASQEVRELPNGCSRLRLRLNSIEEMEGWVLGWGTHATVVRPKVLVDQLRKTTEELRRRYTLPVFDPKAGNVI